MVRPRTTETKRGNIRDGKVDLSERFSLWVVSDDRSPAPISGPDAALLINCHPIWNSFTFPVFTKKPSVIERAGRLVVIELEDLTPSGTSPVKGVEIR